MLQLILNICVCILLYDLGKRVYQLEKRNDEKSN